MASEWQQLWQDFHDALEQPASEREGWLRSRCGSNPDYLRMLGELLAAHARAEHPLDQDWSALVAALPEVPAARQGDVLGHWRLLEPIAEGGMGQVWLVSRCDGEFDKQAALKWIAPQHGFFDGDARFRRERQFLARLEHPNIARLLDGGHDRHSRPYLVMEYVAGEPLTEWCEQRAADWHQRLRLLRTVIEAVAFAHRQMIAHLDLKPGNVLVTATGTPMLLDFGVARSLAFGPADEAGAEVSALTKRYASPEQLLGRPAGVASDVYSLGLMLFELLTGALPFATARHESTGPDGQPLADSPPKLRSVGRAAGCARRLPADLDWVIARALAFEPGQRYSSVQQLGEDLDAVLERRCVRARPQHFFYRAQRLLTRRWQWALATLVFVAIALGLLARLLDESAINAQLLASTRIDRERAEHTVAFLSELFQYADRTHNGGQEPLAREILARGQQKLAERRDLSASDRVVLLNTLSTVYRNLGDYPAATRLIESAVQLLPSVGSSVLEADTLENLGTLRALAGEALAARAPLQRALDLRRARVEPAPALIASAAEKLAANLQTLGEHSAAGALFHEAWELRSRSHPEDQVALAESALRLGSWHWLAGELDEAGRYYRKALTWRRAQTPQDLPELARALDADAALKHAKGAYPEALAGFEQALAIRRRVLGDHHRLTADTLSNLGACYYDQGQAEAAEAPLREALAIYAKTLDTNSPVLAKAVNNLGLVLLDRGDLMAAREQFEHALMIYRSAYGERHARVASVQNNLALVAEAAGDVEVAEQLLRQALAIDSELLGSEHVQTAYLLSNLARVLLWRDRGDQALELFDQAYRIRSTKLPAPHPALKETLLWQSLALCQYGDPLLGLQKIRELRESERQTPATQELAALDARLIEKRCLAATSTQGGEPLSAAEFARWRSLRGNKHPLVQKLAAPMTPRVASPPRSLD